MLWGKQELRLPDLPVKEKGPRAALTKGFRGSADVEPLSRPGEFIAISVRSMALRSKQSYAHIATGEFACLIDTRDTLIAGPIR